MEFVFMFLLVATASFAVVVNLQPGPEGKDTTISSSEPDTNFGTVQGIFIGREGTTYGKTLIEWDVSAIPPNQNIIEASMELYCIQLTGSLSPQITFYLATESRNETTATWNNQPSYNGSVYTEINWPSSEKSWPSVDLTDMVSDWNGGTYDNFGIVGYQEGVTASAGFYSSDCVTPNYRPTLIVEYVEVGIEADSLGSIKACFK